MCQVCVCLSPFGPVAVGVKRGSGGGQEGSGGGKERLQALCVCDEPVWPRTAVD